jgi:enamine deaminase RidA (YjgF/YER057c/UK114 family)
LTLPAATLVEAWTELGASVARAGVRKIVFINSHGGNEEIMGIVARELRVAFKMLAVKTSWSRFGRPAGLYSDIEDRYGIHGGDFETSVMLHFRPDDSVPDDVGAQAELCFANIAAILGEAGLGLKDVVRINAYITDRADMQGYMAVRDRLFPGVPPASTLVIVSGFTRPEFKVEIEVTAAGD